MFVETITTIIRKALSFCRVSSKEQEETGYSLDAQEKQQKEYAQNKNLKVEKTFRVSESASGKQVRKSFIEMLDYATRYKVDVILCEKIDRLTRNLKDAATVDDWVKADPRREIHFLRESFVLNSNTKAHENFVWDMKVAVARFYTNNLSEEVRKGQKEKLAQGWIPMRAKLGYKTIGEKGHKIHVIDENRSPLIVRMFELYATGNYSLKALAATMHKEGLRNDFGNKVLKSRMHELLNDPFYYGSGKWKGQIQNNSKHEPLISKELFNEVQNKLTRKIDSPQFKKHFPIFKGKIHCDECRGTVTWYMKKGHWYGNCSHYKSCSQKGCLRQEVAEEQLFTYFDNVAPKNEKILKWLDDALKAEHADGIDSNKHRKNELTNLIKIADRRIEEAYKDKIDRKAPVDLCEKIISDSVEEKAELSKSLQKLDQDDQPYYEAGYSIHELANHAKEIYLSPRATYDDRRLLLSYVFFDIALNSKKLTPIYTPAFQFMVEWSPKIRNHLRTFSEPTKNPTNSEVSCDSAVTKPVLFPLGSSEPRNHLRTSGNPYPKPRIDTFALDSRLLLRGQDSNL